MSQQLLTGTGRDRWAESLVPRSRTTPVLHIINGEHYAGAERVQDLLGQQLGNFGYRAGFACLKRGQFAAMRKCSDAPLYDVAMKNRFDLSPVWRLARIIRSEGYRLIHTHTARSAVIGRLASMLTGVPLVHHVHSPTTCDTTNRFRNWINCLAERIVLRRAKALIAVSEAVGDYVREQGFGVFVVPNGVPARPAVPARNPAKTDWTLGMIALFRPRKGLEILLEALAQLRGRGLPVRLRAVGSFETPEYESHIRRLAGQLNLDSAIDWAGFARDIDSELAQHGSLRPAQSFWRGAADGRSGSDVGRTAGRGQRRAGRARGRARRRRGPVGRAGQCGGLGGGDRAVGFRRGLLDRTGFRGPAAARRVLFRRAYGRRRSAGI